MDDGSADNGDMRPLAAAVAAVPIAYGVGDVTGSTGGDNDAGSGGSGELGGGERGAPGWPSPYSDEDMDGVRTLGVGPLLRLGEYRFVREGDGVETYGLLGLDADANVYWDCALVP